ncbi:MAG TPA: ParB/RepB/Spo0J family partition protein [Candidatus Andersenbacteria bacterium]|nr:ParB/RepB/Spo0J family partition protein [Candidatus Andersenbacteria bacterium]
MGLGRGLASLIPKRDRGSADDVLEKIDSMEELDETEAQETGAMQDFRDLEPNIEDEVIKPPVKPLVTPIFLDPEEAVEKKVSVTEATTDEELEEEQVEDEEEAVEAPEPEVEQPKEIEPEMPEVPRPEEMEEEETAPDALANEAMKYDGIWDRHEDQILHIPIGDITINPLQPRRSFDQNELKDLQESIAKNGILQPLVVRRLDDNKFELIAGERRLRSAKALKWDKVPCVIRKDVKSDQSRLVFALIENIQRENLNPIEEALAYKQLNEDYGLTHEEIGERVGKSRVGVTNIVRVLQLPAEIQRGMVEGKITMGHAKAILMIPDPEKQIRFYHHLVDEGLTVRKAELRARRIQRTMVTGVSTPRNRLKDRHPLSMKYTPLIEERFGYNTHIKYEEDKHAFEVVLRASNDQELEELVGRLLGTRSLPPSDLDRDVIED